MKKIQHKNSQREQVDRRSMYDKKGFALRELTRVTITWDE